MCCKSLWKTIVPLATAFLLGVLLASLFQKNNARDEYQLRSGEKKVNSISAIDYGGNGGGGSVDEIMPRAETNKIFLISKPRPNYTLAARENNVQGTVRLLVTFLESGQIGDISPINGLPHGLTEEAIKAAKKIKFQPATVEGKAVTVRKTVEYSFAIY